MNIDLPSNLEFKYDCIVLDNTYLKFYAVVKFVSKIKIFETLSKLQNEKNVSLTYIVNKEDGNKFLKNINNIIASAKAEAITNKGQIDSNLVNKQFTEAERLKYVIQIDNEEIFKVSIVICFYGSDIKELNISSKRLEGVLSSYGTIIKPLNFRQKEAYMLSLPAECCSDLHNKIYNIFTTSSLASLYPFYIKNSIEPDGILLGELDREPYMINLFSSFNLNNNICVFGSSGSGKSYFIKSLILKNMYKQVTQIIIDLEGEYTYLSYVLGGTIINCQNINILYVFEQWANMTEDFLIKKIEKVLMLFKDKIKDKFLMEKLRYSIEKAYLEKGITNAINTLYKNDESDDYIYINKKYLNYNEFPTMEDVKRIYIKTHKFVDNNMKELFDMFCINKLSYNLEFGKERLVILNLQEGFNNINLFRFLIDELIHNHTFIYIDEVWRLLQLNNGVYKEIAGMYKTIRKRDAGIIIATQDISDILKYKNGEFGKSIINNAYTKVYFKMTYSDIQCLNRMIPNEEVIKEIKLLNRGEAIIDRGGICVQVNIKNNKVEHSIIEGGQT